MAKKVLPIKNFSGGLNTHHDPRDIKDNEFQALDNVTTDENARIRLSGGFDIGKSTSNLYNSDTQTLPNPSVSVASIHSDFGSVNIPNGDFSYGAMQEELNEWTTSSGDGTGWLKASGITSANLGQTYAVSNLFNNFSAVNDVVTVTAYGDTESANTDLTKNMGYIDSNGIELEGGSTYLLTFSMMANSPYFFSGNCRPPFITIYNEDLDLYKSYNTWVPYSEIDLTTNNLLPADWCHFNTPLTTEDTSDGGSLIFRSDSNTTLDADNNIAISKETGINDSSYVSYMGGTGNGLSIASNNGYGNVTIFNTNQRIVTSDIDLSSSVGDTFLIDFIYKSLTAGSCMRIEVIGVQTGTRLAEKNFQPSYNIYTNANMGAAGFDFGDFSSNNLSAALSFNKGGNTSVKLYIGLKGPNQQVILSGLTMRTNDRVELGGIGNAQTQIFPGDISQSYQYNIGFPNSWNQTTDSPYIQSTWSASKQALMLRDRKYFYSFEIPSSAELSDNWKIRFDFGKWGAVGTNITNLTTWIRFAHLTRTSLGDENRKSHFLLAPRRDEVEHSTRLDVYTYDNNSKKYDRENQFLSTILNEASWHLDADLKFITVNGRTFISNANFNNPGDGIHYFHYDTESGHNDYVLTSSIKFVPTLVAVTTMTSAVAATLGNTFDALHAYEQQDEVNNGLFDYYAGGKNGIPFNSETGVEETIYTQMNGGSTTIGTYSYDEQLDLGAGSGGDGADWSNPPTVGGTEEQRLSNDGVVYANCYGTPMARSSDPSTGAYDEQYVGQFAYPIDEKIKYMTWRASGTNYVWDALTDTSTDSSSLGLQNDIASITVSVKATMYISKYSIDMYGGSNSNHDNATNWEFNFYSGASPWDDAPNVSTPWGSVGGWNELPPNQYIDIDVLEYNSSEGDSSSSTSALVNGGTASMAFVRGWDNNDTTWTKTPVIWTGKEAYKYERTMSHVFNFDFGEFPITSREDEDGNALTPKDLMMTFRPMHNENKKYAWANQIAQEHVSVDTGFGQNTYGWILPRWGIMSQKWDIESIIIQSYHQDYGVTAPALITDIGENEIGLNFDWDTPTTGTANGWNQQKSIRLTTVDYFDEESHLGEVEQTLNSSGNNNHAPELTVSMGVNNTFDFHNIKAIRVYIKTTSSSTANWACLATVWFNDQKIRVGNYGDSYNRQVYLTDDNIQIIGYIIPREQLLSPPSSTGSLTYTALSGLSSQSLGFTPELLTCRFKTAAVVGNRLYVGNILQDSVRYSDRMIVSPVDQFGLLSNEFLDAVFNDGDEIVSLQTYRDKLLQFKKRKLYILNASDDEDLFIEDTIEGVGIHNESQIVKTIHGICWINERGCFLYDGDSVNNLVEDKLAIASWKDTISGWNIIGEFHPILGYSKIEDKLIILPTGMSSSEIYNSNIGDINAIFDANLSDNVYKETWRTNLSYVYDFKRKSWQMNYAGQRGVQNELPDFTSTKLKLPFTNSRKSNFFYGANDELMIMSDATDDLNGGILSYNDNPMPTPGYQDFESDRNMRIVTKDYDFGDPSIRKKIYKVYITFKTTDINTMLVENAKLTKDFYSSSYVKAYYALDGSDTWIPFSESKSKNYIATRGLVDEDSENTTILMASLDNTETLIYVSDSSHIKTGYILSINGEQMLVKNITNNGITVERGYGYTVDESNTLQNVEGIEHISASVIYISNGDWIQAELVPEKTINNAKSIKVMLVAAQASEEIVTYTNAHENVDEVTTTETTITAGEQLIDLTTEDWSINTHAVGDWDNDPNTPTTVEDIGPVGEINVTSPTTLQWNNIITPTETDITEYGLQNEMIDFTNTNMTQMYRPDFYSEGTIDILGPNKIRITNPDTMTQAEHSQLQYLYLGFNSVQPSDTSISPVPQLGFTQDFYNLIPGERYLITLTIDNFSSTAPYSSSISPHLMFFNMTQHTFGALPFGAGADDGPIESNGLLSDANYNPNGYPNGWQTSFLPTENDGYPFSCQVDFTLPEIIPTGPHAGEVVDSSRRGFPLILKMPTSTAEVTLSIKPYGDVLLGTDATWTENIYNYNTLTLSNSLTLPSRWYYYKIIASNFTPMSGSTLELGSELLDMGGNYFSLGFGDVGSPEYDSNNNTIVNYNAIETEETLSVLKLLPSKFEVEHTDSYEEGDTNDYGFYRFPMDVGTSLEVGKTYRIELKVNRNNDYFNSTASLSESEASLQSSNGYVTLIHGRDASNNPYHLTQDGSIEEFTDGVMHGNYNNKFYIGMGSDNNLGGSNWNETTITGYVTWTEPHNTNYNVPYIYVKPQGFIGCGIEYRIRELTSTGSYAESAQIKVYLDSYENITGNTPIIGNGTIEGEFYIPSDVNISPYLNFYEAVQSASVQLSLKEKISEEVSTTETTVTTEFDEIIAHKGSVPKGFQINDMSIVYKTKNVK